MKTLFNILYFLVPRALILKERRATSPTTRYIGPERRLPVLSKREVTQKLDKEFDALATDIFKIGKK